MTLLVEMLKPKRSRSLFRRPRTADSESSTKSSRSMRLLSIPWLGRNDVVEEPDQSSNSSLRSEGGATELSPFRTVNSLHARSYYHPHNGGVGLEGYLSTSPTESRISPIPPRVDLPNLTDLPRPCYSTPAAGLHSPASLQSPLSAVSLRSLSDTSEMSTGSGFHVSGPLAAAVADPTSTIYLSRLGTVACGTLAGLVERLINNFSEPKI